MSPLKISFRQHQLQDVNDGNANVVVDCGTIATYVHGDVDPAWYEMTKYTEGLDKFQSSWDAVNQRSSEATATNAVGSNYDKGISLSLTFWGDAFDFIWVWLLANECQILNAIDVRIDDVLCGKSYRLFEIKCDNLNYKPEFNCRIDVQLREQDLVWHCIHKTFIWDDWQGWFNQHGTSTKAHPTFLVCIEPRPRLMNSVRLALVFFLNSFPFFKAIDFISGGNNLDDTRRVLDLDNFVPSPLIRDYIDNVAMKCGLSTDTIFHRVGTPEYNACIFHPLSGSMYENISDNEMSSSTAFIFENRWDITLAELLDKLKVLYAAEWYVTPNNTIVFKPTSELIDLAPIADLTTGHIPIRKLEYSFNGTKKPAYGRYQYQPDGSDIGSQEISNLYNDLTDYDGSSNNPMLEGELNKSFDFAPTAFVRDGRTKDYIEMLIDDAETGAFILLIIVWVLMVYAASLAVTALLQFFPNAGPAETLIVLGVGTLGWAGIIKGIASNMRSHFTGNSSVYTGAVRLVTANQTMQPRVLVWDGAAFDRAKVVKTTAPMPSAYYNPDAVPYTTSNNISQDNGAGNVFNYPMYFDSKYTGNMFDRFHDAIDNPLKSKDSHQEASFETDMCCDAMDLLGLWEDDFVKIGYLLLIEHRVNYDVLLRIEHIDSSYESWSIKIKGKVIKRKN